MNYKKLIKDTDIIVTKDGSKYMYKDNNGEASGFFDSEINWQFDKSWLSNTLIAEMEDDTVMYLYEGVPLSVFIANEPIEEYNCKLNMTNVERGRKELREYTVTIVEVREKNVIIHAKDKEDAARIANIGYKQGLYELNEANITTTLVNNVKLYK